jgi:hypothetical protein
VVKFVDRYGLSEHKHCDNSATNVNRMKMLDEEMRQILGGSVSTGAKEDVSSTGHVWAAGFHHVTARSRLVELMNRLFL